MPVSDFFAVFPNLRDSPHRETSRATIDYNCVAWALNDQRRWWQPWGIIAPASPPWFHWPNGVEHASTVEAYAAALATEGYAPCANGDLEAGQAKVVLYRVGGDARH